MKHKIEKKEYRYLGHDTYGFSAECLCGKTITGFSEGECEENIKKHLNQNE